MGRSKRQQRRRPTLRRQHDARKTGPTVNQELAAAILACLGKHGRPLLFGDILAELAAPATERSLIKKTLTRLCRQRRLIRQGKTYRLPSTIDLLTAQLEVTSRGFAFATVAGEPATTKDVFITAANIGDAVSGDTVLIEITGLSRGRREGRVVKVQQRAFSRVSGIFSRAGSVGYVHADNQRLPHDILIRAENCYGAEDGQVVLVQITDYGSPTRGPEGRILEVLGSPESALVQIRMVAEQFHLPQSFSPEALAEAEALQPIVHADADRQDLRDIDHVTIDGATARDFDDAIAVKRTGTGFQLYVSIADVATYVVSGSALDQEAYKRGTSVYLPDKVIPMLPERLSNDLCSLVPQQDRPAFTVLMDFDAQGRRTGQRFFRSLITSRQRFTYDTVHQLVYQKQPAAAPSHHDLLPMLRDAARLADLLHQRRLARGSIGFNLPEARITLAGDQVVSITQAERNQAHQLIEECMLAANEAVAELLVQRQAAALFRIHERPDPGKVEAFTDATKAMGLALPKSEATPAWFARVLNEAAGTTAEYVINALMLRTMQQARYAPECTGHFGLAAEHYLHFTSPIRRYPDLVAHRVLAGILAGNPTAPLSSAGLAEAGLYLSQRERVSVEVERSIRARLSALYLRERVGERFQAIISGVAAFGLFVELTDCFISGAVPVASMTDDYYLFDGRGHRLIGERSNKVYQLGHRIEVQLEHVDLTSHRLTFHLVPDHLGKGEALAKGFS